MVLDLKVSWWNEDLKHVFFFDTPNKLFEFNVIGLGFLIKFPEITIGFSDLDIFEDLVRLCIELDLKSEVLGND